MVMKQVTPRMYIIGAFRWFALGAVFIASSLLGVVSADQPVTTESAFRTALLSLGGLGTLLIIIGLLVLFVGLFTVQRREG